METLPPVPPAKKSSRGCLIALAIVGGIALSVVGVGGYAAYRFMQSPEGQKLVQAIGEGTTIATEALSAPGTAELRELGCDTAMAMDVERMAKLAGAFAPEGEQPEEQPQAFRTMVMCELGLLAQKSITCDAVAATFLKAVGKHEGRFAAMVQGKGEQVHCSVLYEADGTSVGPIDTASP